jgi:hypothetical protein
MTAEMIPTAIQIFLSFYQLCMPNTEADFKLCIDQMTVCYSQSASFELPEDDNVMEACSEQIPFFNKEIQE